MSAEEPPRGTGPGRGVAMDHRAPTPAGRPHRDVAGHVLIIVENVAAGMDHRVSKQIDTLLASGYCVRAITRKHIRNQRYRATPRVRFFEYPSPPEPNSLAGYLLEYGYSFIAATLLSARAAVCGRIDVVQFCQPPDIYFPLARVFRKLGARIIVDQRDLLSELYAARYGENRQSLLGALRFLEKLSHSSADGVICVNEYLQGRALAASGLPADRVSVVRNGPVLARVAGARGDESLKRGREYLCCWVGMMARQDRLDLLLRSIHHVVHELGRHDCEFAILGSGECLEEMRALANELKLDEWVHFTGWVPEEVVFQYLATADIGLDASLQFEVSPVKAMEYMAFGLPFVAFDLPETRAISNGACAYVPPGDIEAHAQAIDILLASPPRRQALGLAGQIRVRDELAWENQARTYVKVIEQLCRARKRRRRRDSRGRRR